MRRGRNTTENSRAGRWIDAIRLYAAIGALILKSSGALAQAPSPSPNASTAPAGSSTAGAVKADTSAAIRIDPQAVIAYLNDVINWYRHLGDEAQFVSEPSEMLFFSSDTQTADQILDLAFESARAQADLIEKTTGGAEAVHGAAAPGNRATDLAGLQKRSGDLEAGADSIRARIKDLQGRLASAAGPTRAQLASQIAAAQGELDLTQAQLDAIAAIIQFESRSSASAQGGGLRAKIDQLERSIPKAARDDHHERALATLARNAEPSGLYGLAVSLSALQSKMDALGQTANLARDLSARIVAARKPLLDRLHGIESRGDQLAQAGGPADVAGLLERKRAFEALADEQKLVIAAGLPLSEQAVLLDQYQDNLARWRAAVQRRSIAELRSLVLRAIVLAIIFLLIFTGAVLWRRLTDRYVQDIRRRGQVLAARRFAIGLIVVAVVLINFSGEIGSAATVLGFAAAGIALALQNVILSVAGYFFLIGRFGIKVGDRVEIGSVTGDVVDIGLVKLSLMELGGVGGARQPTGRVAVFSNAVVFQPNGNFFKQAPGGSFIWNEVRLTLAPDCDYRLAEKRLLEAVQSVFARYDERVERDWRSAQLELNIFLESPKPQALLNLGPSGLTVTIRYPAETYSAPQIADEVARRVLDAIDREPGLRLAMKDGANIQAEPLPDAPGGGDPPLIQTDPLPKT